MKFLGLLSLAGAVAAHDYSVCSGNANKLGVQSVDISPDPVIAGDNLKVSFTGTSTADITEGTAELDVKVMKINLYHAKYDICKDLGVSCPIKAGEKWSGSITQSIPKEVMGGVKVGVEVKFTDNNNADAGCVDMKVEIDKKKQQLFGAEEAYNQFLFTKWSKQYSKDYGIDEVFDRYSTFTQNVARIANHDAEETGFTQDMNEFGDLTFEEFKATHFGYTPGPPRDYLKSQNLHEEILTDIPSAVDWRAKGAVSEVKNQGQCGSCWAFSTVGAVEGINAITTGKLQQFSEQELVDCGSSEGSSGCNGGLMDFGFEYAIKNGLCKEADYPYTATENTCKKSSCTSAVKVTGFKDVQAKSEKALLSALAQQPVSIAIEADQMSFQFYSGGVFSKECGQNLDHGVLAVGYGTDTGKDYWIVKNSWGPTWGEKGYIRFIRGNGIDQCGIENSASYPTMGSSFTNSE